MPKSLVPPLELLQLGAVPMDTLYTQLLEVVLTGLHTVLVDAYAGVDIKIIIIIINMDTLKPNAIILLNIYSFTNLSNPENAIHTLHTHTHLRGLVYIHVSLFIFLKKLGISSECLFCFLFFYFFFLFFFNFVLCFCFAFCVCIALFFSCRLFFFAVALFLPTTCHCNKPSTHKYTQALKAHPFFDAVRDICFTTRDTSADSAAAEAATTTAVASKSADASATESP